MDIEEEKLERIVDEKLDKRLKTETGKDSAEQKGSENLSRRNFLKKASLGVAGLGAASLLPRTAALNIESNNPLKYNQNLSVDSAGRLKTNHIDVNRISLGDDGPAKSFSDIGNQNRSWAGLMYKDSNNKIVGRNLVSGSKYGPSSDAGEVLEKLANDIGQNNPAGGKDEVGNILLRRGNYVFESTARLEYNCVRLQGETTQQGDQGATKLLNGGVGSGNSMIRVEGNNFSLENVYMRLGHADVYGVHIWSTDRHYFDSVEIERVGTNGEAIRVSGTYQSHFENCLFKQAHFRINPDTGKNVNNCYLDRCNFQSDNAEAVPLKIVDGGNQVVNSVVNAGDLVPSEAEVSGLAKSPSGPNKRWNFYATKFFGSDSGGKMINTPRQSRFQGCFFLGGGDAIFTHLNDVDVIGCSFGANYQIIKLDGSDDQINRCVFFGNNVESCSSGGNAAFEKVEGGSARNDSVVINSNVFRGSGNYSIDLGKNQVRNGVSICNNLVRNGIRAEWGGGPYPSGIYPGNVRIEGNTGYNPVGVSRTDPNLPSGTGRDNGVVNLHAQSAIVYQEGHKDTVLENREGDTKSIGGSVNTVKIEPFGLIYYDTETPDSWTWWWQ